ncbi:MULTISPECIES: Glu/Leu/Phe/Val family dehydrogenase [Methanocorpusculum]|jgi:glutamate dehydrogenase (NAD(P)+)|uniref:Glutamate dehydrogenase n=1 Tax=Methanocorpusculum parvum TaxID=2193 RepID=A0AAX0Q6T5_9EURY|nr:MULTISPECIES: Glu/Leu/Phe/Val dehydrogenase [Methanocorpusculum]MDD2803440.1 Glu/Leu/Phe/Val dehydrogenase [Methanocorpusculum sp.]MDD3047286.1 Glu/Leu/Phe/Val dehydrogenase [Methanocorpusculum sp.]MDY3202537.1 Glu/Leu/Phe/Val dehydrogenase [Methanocorpusculum sp.]MEA5087242.1 Glu/Leu/Phe/Val dehydrogenase [Methanocorpusculum sp.]NLC91007.1 Glu/Leu/Phe/Val dehydrogenase [Methanocorpusculum parvum]
MSKVNPFEMAQQQLLDCAKILKLDQGVVDILMQPQRQIQVSIPVKMDDGTTRVFQGFRVQYNNALGPYKGGIRYHPEETIDTVRALSAWMTWKCAVLNLPLGGGKGGIICNPKEMSKGELERLSRGYIRAIWKNLGPDTDVPAPDVYTDGQIMAWMMDEYSVINGKNQFGLLTGKPLIVGGSLGRGDATAKGGLYTLREAAKELNLDLKKATVAILGFGNAGSFAATLVQEMFGSKVVAVTDSKGGIYDANGLDITAVSGHKTKTKSVTGFKGLKTLTNDEVMGLPVDIIIAAAPDEGAINEKVAPTVKAKVICELANGPTTPEGDAILFKNGVHVIPDFLCNAGGVTVSYYEMVQNMYMHYWTLDDVYAKLDAAMTQSYHNVLKASKEYKINMRQAAYVVAVARVVEGMKIRGWV